jgi:acyl-ACP thioesterase
LYSYQNLVTASQVDRHKKMRIAALFDLMADCEQLQIDNAGSLGRYMSERRAGIFLCYRQADLLRRPAYGETLTATTFIYDLNPVTGRRNTVIYDARGEVILRSYGIGAFVDLKTGGMTTIDRSFVTGYPLSQKLDMAYTSRKVNPPVGTAAIPAAAYPAPESHIDAYGHVNNAKYILTAAEYLADEDAPRRVRVEYKSPARYGDTVRPLLYREPDALTVALTDDKNEKTVYAVVEFSNAGVDK